MNIFENVRCQFCKCMAGTITENGLLPRTVMAAVTLMLLGSSTFSYAGTDVLVGSYPANITRTAWEMHRSELVQTLGFNLESREDLAAYQDRLINIPDDPDGVVTSGATYDTKKYSYSDGWVLAPNLDTIGFSEKSRISDKDGNYGCKSAVDYSYFQTWLDVPSNVDVTTFTINFSGIDEGARVSVFNSKFPNGEVVKNSYVYLDTSGQYPGGQLVTLEDNDLDVDENGALGEDYITTGLNRIVVTQVDNCPAKFLGNQLQTAEITFDGVEVPTADAFILQAVTSVNSLPTGSISTGQISDAIIRALISGEPHQSIPGLEVLTSSTCSSSGELGGVITPIGDLVLGSNATHILLDNELLEEVEGYLDVNGEAYIQGTFSGVQMERYVSVRAKSSSGSVGATSTCIVAGPDNDSWIRASLIELTPESTSSSTSSASVAGWVDSLGNARWFKFAIQPGERANIKLHGLPADYDIAVFKDISQAFEVLIGNADVDGLNRLGAEYAFHMFSPAESAFHMFSPDEYAFHMFSPDEYAFHMFSPTQSAFHMFSPHMFSPHMFSPHMFSPHMFSPHMFSPDIYNIENYTSAQVRSLINISAQPGTLTDKITADTWNNTGYFYVRVSGKNGVYDIEDSFQLSVNLDGVNCDGVGPIAHSGITATADGYNSVILLDSTQLLASGSSQAEVDLLKGNNGKLEQLAARTEVNGVIVDLADFAHIQALHAQADDHSSCPYAANLTAQAIKEVIDAYRDANPGLKYVVLAGGDAEIPFFRYPDQELLAPERNYEPPVADGTHSQAALRRNYILSQDEYGASQSLSLTDSHFPVPELAVGRLVETVPDMISVIDAYLQTTGGVVTPQSSLVTGYDFLTDAADEIQAHFEQGLGAGATTDSLITDYEVPPDTVCSETTVADRSCSWTAQHLADKLMDNNREDIIFLAGHFSANSALAADYNSSLITTEFASSSADLTNSVVFSAGCHSGYNIVDGEIVPNLTEKLDWTQAFAQKGANLIAGTGYQYGDTDFIAYSERLYLEFTKKLRTGLGPVAIGEALVKAKQEYLSTTPDIRGLHRKSVLISTLFGLPMLSVDMAGTRIAADLSQPALVAAPVAEWTPGYQLGLATGDISLSFDGVSYPLLSETQIALSNTSDNSTIYATYLVGPDGILTNPGEPAIPLVTLDVSAEDVNGSELSLRGVGFRSGAWTEQFVVPFTGAPTTELTGVHTPFSSLVNFPFQLAKPNYFGAMTDSGGTNLHVTPAQHRVINVDDAEATLRQYDNLEFRLFYSNNTETFSGNTPALAGAPAMTNIQAVKDEASGDINFFVNVVGAPAVGIQSVWVTYTDGAHSTGQWKSVDLNQNDQDSTLWTGSIPALEAQYIVSPNFMVQATNGNGSVARDDNFGKYHQLQQTGTVPSNLTLHTDVYSLSYGDTIDGLSATLTDENGAIVDAPVLFSIGGTTRIGRTDSSGIATVSLPLSMTPPGDHLLNVYFPGDNKYLPANAEQAFSVTRANTSLVLFGPLLAYVNNDGSVFSADLRDQHGSTIRQRTVYFTVVDELDGIVATVPVITDNKGIASFDLGSLNLPEGSYTIEVRFLGTIPTGGAPHLVDSPLYNESYDYQTFDVTKIPTRLTINAGTQVAGVNGIDSGVTVILEIDDENGGVLAGNTVTFEVYDSSAALVFTREVVTDAIGTASLGELALPPGTFTVTANFPGDSATYEASSASTTLYLISGTNCPTSDTFGKISITGFCYLNYSVDGKVVITDGTLIINGFVDQKVEQFGSGSVRITKSGVVRGMVVETGPGEVEVFGTVGDSGQVGGQIIESGDGDVVVNAGAIVYGNTTEEDAGSVIISGMIEGNVFESGDGFIEIKTGGIVTGGLQQD